MFQQMHGVKAGVLTLAPLRISAPLHRLARQMEQKLHTANRGFDTLLGVDALVVQGADRRLVPFLARVCRRERVVARKTHTDIARVLGVARTTVGRWEKGQMSRPDLDAIMNAYASVTGVPVERLWRQALDAWRPPPTANGRAA